MPDPQHGPVDELPVRAPLRDVRKSYNRLRSGIGQELDLSQGFHDFHAVVLGNGSVPLDVLEDVVDQWIAAGGGAPA